MTWKTTVYPKTYSGITYSGPWLYSSGSINYAALLAKPISGNTIIELENISDYLNGVGYAGTGHQICDTDYTLLVENTDFYYDETWDGTGAHAINKYDILTAGALSSGKVFRVVNDVEGVAKNLIDATGLALQPLVKELNTDLYSPPANQFYIDPLNAKIIIPRPSYWSKFEDEQNIITSAEINTKNASVTFGGSHSYSFDSAKFNNGLVLTGESGIGSYCSLYPHGSSYSSIGTLSLWGATAITGTSSSGFESYIKFNLNDTTYFKLYHTYGSIVYELYINGFLASSAAFSWYTFTHIYIVWNSSGSLTGGKSIRVFLNNVEKASSTTIFTVNQNFLFSYALANTGATIATKIDNVKTWDYVVYEDASWDYNSGLGIEDSLHYMYGSTNSYKPKLSGVGGVGYYKSASAGSFVTGIV
jgi:hypothetical protein